MDMSYAIDECLTNWISNGELFEKEHKKTNYDELIKLKSGIKNDFKDKINKFKPDVIFHICNKITHTQVKEKNLTFKMDMI